eukprot:Phypoly_transcript_10641.p1 GENE.Phypoly_transcript_10641~~Phypoly_transcript_10641.p1  ORF type:complete len:413 (+),score=137.37 Phypoly_transcript_10641:177-1241(+)
MKWGYMGNNPQLSTINARAEGITSSPMWSKLISTNRCAVVASGYFEWQTTGGKKQPHYLHFKDRPLIVMAGLYEEQLEENESDSVFHYTIITTANAKDIGWLHDRMPVILDTDEKIDLWISGDYATQKNEILSLLKPYEGLECYAVPELVNSNRNDTPDCLKRNEEFKKTGGIAAFFQAPKKETPGDADKSGDSKKSEEKRGKKEEKKKRVGIAEFFAKRNEDAEKAKAKEEERRKDEAKEDAGEGKDKKEEEQGEEEEERKEQMKEEIKEELKEEIKAEVIEELKHQIKDEVTAEIKEELKKQGEEEVQEEMKEEQEEDESKEKEAKKKTGTKRKKPATVTKDSGAKKGKSKK